MDSVETWRRKYGPAFALFHAGLFMMAVHFGASIWAGGSPVTPELYGPAVYYIPAVLWAAAQMLGSVIAAIGSLYGEKWGAAMMVAGGGVSLVVYLMFVVLAQRAEQGTIVQAAGIWCAAPGSALTVIAGVGAWKYGRKR